LLLAAAAALAGCKKSDAPGTRPSAAASEEAPMFEPATASAGSAEPEVDAGPNAAPRARRRAEAPPLAPPPRKVDPKSAAAKFDDYGFPVVSAVEHLCGRREYPSHGVHLTWDAFASDVAPKELVTRYQKRLGKAGFTAEGAGGAWRLPPAGPTTRTLDVLALDAQGPHRGCEAKPGPGAKSVIVISRR
jgi:hypothetical protein